MRLFLMSFAAVAFFFLVGMALKIWGEATPYQRFEHPLRSPALPKVVIQTESLKEAFELHQNHPEVMIWLNVHVTQNKVFLVGPRQPLNAEIVQNLTLLKGPFVPRYTDEELKVVPALQPLALFLKEIPTQKFVLHLMDNEVDLDRTFVDFISSYEPEKRFLISSDVDVVLRSIKQLRPQWLFSSSYADLNKLLSLESVGLISISPFAGDVLVTPLEILGRSVLNLGVRIEIQKRKKDFMIGPVRNKEDLEKIKIFNDHPADSIIYASKDLYLATQ